jgi:exodeoxyribonuclease VII large subunit
MNFDWNIPFFAEEPTEQGIDKDTKIYTVSELTSEIRDLLEDSYPTVWVEAELSNYKKHQDKHLFFTLKDENSQIDGVMFAPYAQKLSFNPENGMQVIVQGRVSYYQPQGRTQIVVYNMFLKGKGALFVALHKLKLKLHAEGLFDESHKKKLPLLPAKIGIVTSPTGAAIRDIIKVIKQRHPNLEIILYPSRVQGEEAPAELIEGIQYFNKEKNVDVIILTRGGGSIEDLWAFNDENLARAIYASSIPIISAVGHEIDQSISDLVADISAPTPTAAALIVVKAKDELKQAINNLTDKLYTNMLLKIEKYKRIFMNLIKERSFQQFPYFIEYSFQHIAELTDKLYYGLNKQLSIKQSKFDQLNNKLNIHLLELYLQKQKNKLQNIFNNFKNSINNVINKDRERMNVINAKLNALSPFSILSRGYSICFDEEKKVIHKDSSLLRLDQKVYVKLYKGSFKSIIKEVSNDE